jgi:hypothetical protein
MSCHFMPFVVCLREGYLLFKRVEKEIAMNWVFETYSNVYNTAMMQDTKSPRSVTAAKSDKTVRSTFARLFGRA